MGSLRAVTSQPLYKCYYAGSDEDHEDESHEGKRDEKVDELQVKNIISQVGCSLNITYISRRN